MLLKRWLSFGLSADQEERYRRAYLGADAAHARISILLLLVPMVGFAVNDYGFFGLSWRFYGIAALRLGLLLYSIVLLTWLRGCASYRSYDRSVLAWGLILAVLTVTIHATRPPTFIAHAIIAVVIVFAMVLAIPNRFVNQLLLAVAYTAGETLVVAPGLWRSRQAGVTVLLSMFVANTIAIACAWQLHAWRRREFLAREEERNAKAEAEKQLAERQQAEQALRGSEQRFHSLFDQMTEGFALHEIILDKQGVPCDYRFLEVNPAFEQLTGLYRDKVLEKTLSQVLPNDDPKWVRIYGEVALTGKAVHFNNYSPALKRHYDVLAYCPAQGRFAVLFTDITERKRAEEETKRLLAVVQQERDKLSTLINSINDEIWFADAEKRFSLANPAALREFGYDPAAGSDVEKLAESLEVYRPDGSPRPVEEAPPLRALRGEVVKDQEEIVRTPATGDLRHRQVSAAPVKDASGNIIGSVSVVRDITERKRAEHQSAANLDAMTRLQKLGTMFVREGNLGQVLGEIVEAALAIAAADFGNIQLLDAETETLRIVAQRGFPQWWIDFWSNVSRGHGVCGTAMERRERVIIEDVKQSPIFIGTPAMEIQLKAGVRAVQSTPLLSRSGKLLGMFSTHYKMPHRPDQRALQLLDLLARQAADIIERTQAEAAVLESERRLRSVLENMSEGLMLFDAQGDVIYQNAVSLRIHGFEPRKEDERVEGEFLKATWKGWDDKDRPLPPDEWPMSRIFREERFENQILHAQRVETGYEFDASYNGSPLYDSAGNLIGGFITIRDITDHKRAQDALIRSEKLASVGRMAATVAHEINNPLEAVMSLLFLAKENKELPESVRQYLETADAELNRIAHITRQSLGFYRESNAPAVTSVNAVLESAVDLLKSKIKAKQAVIEKQWHGDMQVTAVAGELRQVFSNLLANSLDAIDAKGTIKVRVSTGAAFKNGDRCVRVTVADNGKGISPSSRQHLFEPFFTTKGTVGTGLGLWVSKQIVEKHGGTIRMRSSGNAARKGAVFSVVLPVMSAVARRQSAGA